MKKMIVLATGLSMAIFGAFVSTPALAGLSDGTHTVKSGQRFKIYGVVVDCSGKELVSTAVAQKVVRAPQGAKVSFSSGFDGQRWSKECGKQVKYRGVYLTAPKVSQKTVIKVTISGNIVDGGGRTITITVNP